MNPVMVEALLSANKKLMDRLVPHLTKHSLTIPQYFILGLLKDSTRPLAMNEIASFMQHTTAATTGIIERMHSLGLVRRKPTRKDRRVMLIELTPKSRRILEALSKEMADVCERMVALLTPEESAAWTGINNKLLGFVEQNLLPFDGLKKLAGENTAGD